MVIKSAKPQKITVRSTWPKRTEDDLEKIQTKLIQNLNTRRSRGVSIMRLVNTVVFIVFAFLLGLFAEHHLKLVALGTQQFNQLVGAQ